MTHRRILQGAFVTVVSVIGLVVIFFILKRPDPIPLMGPITLQPLPTTISATPTPSTISVYVSGAVRNPDVFQLAPGSNVKDAIAAAGGASDEADLDRINLAAHLTDQMHVHIPHKGESPAVPLPGETPAGASGALININTATLEELDTLPNIGPSTANAIVAYRTEHGLFKTIEDIKNVPRIGDSTFEKIKDKITVGP